MSSAPSAISPDALEACRPAVQRLCYRMLGAMSEAEDATQEAMLRAWKAAPSFEGRASLTTWVCRIATRVCLDAQRKRRSLPPLLREAGAITDDLDLRDEALWIEPAARAWLHPHPSAEDAVIQQEAISLAWVVALQQLSAKQRAAFLLMEVLGLSAEDAAATLKTSTAAANSSLQRARAALGDRPVEPNATPADLAAVQRFAEAFARYDLDALATMLRDDTTMSMPPLALWLRGGQHIVAWMGGRGAGCRGSRLIATHANGSPAWAQYRPDPEGGHSPWALVMPEARGGHIHHLHFFLSTDALFPRFGLPTHLD